MSPRHRPTEEEALQAVDRLLSALESDADIFDALNEIRRVHPEHNTFPGEVFVRLAADALAAGDVRRERPLSEERIVEAYLPECEFRGRDNRKLRYALLAVAATSGGVEVDLLDEVAYWRTDDFWSYAAFAAVAWIRAVSHQREIPLTELCARLRAGFTT